MVLFFSLGEGYGFVLFFVNMHRIRVKHIMKNKMCVYTHTHTHIM